MEMIMAEHVEPTLATLEAICRLMKFYARLAKEAFEAGNEALYLQYLGLIDDLAACKARLSSTLDSGGGS